MTTSLSQTDIPFDPKSTEGCPSAGQCEECGGVRDLQVKSMTNGLMTACITVCGPCRRDDGVRVGSKLLLTERARVHADEHLGIASDLVRGALTVRQQGVVDEVYAVPSGPYRRQPGALLWLLTGGGHHSVAAATSRDAASWLHAALEDADLQATPYEREVADRVANNLDVTDLEVVAGWFRRARSTGRR